VAVAIKTPLSLLTSIRHLRHHQHCTTTTTTTANHHPPHHRHTVKMTLFGHFCIHYSGQVSSTGKKRKITSLVEQKEKRKLKDNAGVKERDEGANEGTFGYFIQCAKRKRETSQ